MGFREGSGTGFTFSVRNDCWSKSRLWLRKEAVDIRRLDKSMVVDAVAVEQVGSCVIVVR